MPAATSLPLASPTGLAQAIARLAHGRDPAAWEIVVEQAREHLWRMVSRLSDDRQIAEDAVQDALLLVRDHANTFRDPGHGSDAAALRWMMTIAANAAIGIYRKRTRKRECLLEETNLMTTKAQASTALEFTDTMTAIRRELSSLPESTRQPIMLHYLCGMQIAEVALSLGIPVGSAKVRVHRGIKALRERLRRSGIALSVVILIGLLEQLPAITAPDAALYSSLITSPLVSTQSLPHRGLFQEFSMASKIALAASVVCAIGIIPFISGQDGPGASVPGASAPGHAAPEASVPGASVPGASASNNAAPGASVPGAVHAHHAVGATPAGAIPASELTDSSGKLTSHTGNTLVVDGEKWVITAQTEVMVDSKKASVADLKDGKHIMLILKGDVVVIARQFVLTTPENN